MVCSRRCVDCCNKPEADGEDGLASLASAAQIAANCLNDDALYQLTPGTAAAVAPYHQQMARAAAVQAAAAQALFGGAHSTDALAAEPSAAWAARPNCRSRPASDSEDGCEPNGGGKKRRSSSLGSVDAANRGSRGGSGGGSVDTTLPARVIGVSQVRGQHGSGRTPCSQQKVPCQGDGICCSGRADTRCAMLPRLPACSRTVRLHGRMNEPGLLQPQPQRRQRQQQ